MLCSSKKLLCAETVNFTGNQIIAAAMAGQYIRYISLS